MAKPFVAVTLYFDISSEERLSATRPMALSVAELRTVALATTPSDAKVLI